MSMIRVKCFGVAKEIVDKEILELGSESMSVLELRAKLMNSFPDFASIKGFMIAVNQEYATDEMVLSSSDEVAIIPPVSGG